MRDRFIRRLTIDWDCIDAGSYLRSIAALRCVRELTFESDITLFAGENGTGKSTLLEAIAVACGFNPEGGTRNFNFSTYDDVSALGSALKLIKGSRPLRSGYFFRAESFFNVATAIMREYNYDGRMPDYHVQSHGESFLSYMQASKGPGLYLMDEPEAALSPQSQLTLLIHIARLARDGSQFVIATHSPILLALPDARIISFDDGALKPCDYEDTASYRVTRLFIENRERMLKMLLDE